MKSNKIVIKGNERVIRARFYDAEFFYNEDTKIHISEFLENLSLA